MRITITAEGGEPVNLCDHGREGPSGLVPVPLRKVDINEFVQGIYSKPKNRGNTLNQLSFTKSTEHQDYAAAQLYLFRLNDTVPPGGTLLIELDDEMTLIEALNATVELAPLPILGVMTTVAYTIKYGKLNAIITSVPLRDSEGKLIKTADGKQVYVKKVIL